MADVTGDAGLALCSGRLSCAGWDPGAGALGTISISCSRAARGVRVAQFNCEHSQGQEILYWLMRNIQAERTRAEERAARR